MFVRVERPYHPRMRTQRITLLAAALLLAACSSDSSKGGITPGDTSAPGSTAPGSTLPDTWVPSGTSPTLFFVNSRGTFDAPDFAVSKLTVNGPSVKVTDLWTETEGNGVTVLDASADLSRLLLRRYAYDADSGNSTITLSERDLASGAETVVITMAQSFAAQYADDDSGDVLVSFDEDHADGTGVITSTTHHLNRYGIDGTQVAEVATRESGETYVDLNWLQVDLGGQPAVVLSGTPMTVVGPSGDEQAALANDRQCTPVRQAGAAAIIAACSDISEYATQLWSVPLDGTAATQITKVTIDPSGIDFGAWNLWATADGRQWVQRTGDCGAVWVEELQANGTTVDAAAQGWILGVDGTQLITAVNGSCDGGLASVMVYDSVSGGVLTLTSPPVTDSDETTGVNGFEILTVPG